MCPFFSRMTSATTRPSLQSGYCITSAVPGTRQMSPGIGAGILVFRVVDVAGLGVDHIGEADARAAAIFRGPGRGFGQGLAAEFIFARFEDEREIGGRRFAQRRHRGHQVSGTEKRERAGIRLRCGEKACRDWRLRAQPAAGEAEPAVHAAREKIGAQEAVGSHAALRVADEPESFHVLLADLIDERGDDILQVLVVGRGPDARRRIRRGDDQAVFADVVEEREIVALPVAVGARAVNAENQA